MINQVILPTKMDVTSRDVTCFVFAAAIHSLLFLWQGGLLTLPEKAGDGLGDMLVGVNFMAEVPDYDLPGGGGGAPKAKGFLARVSSLLKGQGSEQIKSKPAGEMAQNWSKTDQLVDKSFQARQGFQGMKDKVDTLDIAKGQDQQVVVKPSQGNFEQAQPNLKESRFKVAKNDVPFPILKPKTPDALVNVNAIPVVVGKTTSDSVRSLEGGPGAGPALQSKSFASKGGSTGGSFGGMTEKSGSSSGSGGLQIAMGGGAGAGAAGSGLIGAGGGAGGYGGSGYGSGGTGGGRGGGTGDGTGTGTGSGSGRGGRTWGGGSGGAGEMKTLSRRSVPMDQPAGMGGKADHGGFTITGALANRPIEGKVLPAYEMDSRVALRFRVDWSGKVLDGIVVEISSGSPTFDQKVMTSLKKWIFSRLPANRTNEVQEGLVSFIFKGV